jgi:hypothetical protein
LSLVRWLVAKGMLLKGKALMFDQVGVFASGIAAAVVVGM